MTLSTPSATPPPTPRTTARRVAPHPPGGVYTVEVAHVTKRYGDHTVVDDLSFTVPPGRVTGFLGPNGSGKSTTMKIMLDLAAATRGAATIGGQSYRELPDPARIVGAMIESDAFHPGRSGRNHLRILADATGIAPTRVDEMLEQVGLADAANRKAGAYSLGMRQRLGLAAALMGEPPVLILDEPGNGLDPQGIRTLRDLLRSHAARGGTVFVSSHLLSEVEHLADDVIVINQGRLVTHGSLADLQQSAALVRSADAGRLDAALQQAGASTERPRRRRSRRARHDRSTRSATVPSPSASPYTNCHRVPGRSRSCS